MLSLTASFVLSVAAAVHAQTFTVLHNFTGGSDGSGPQTGLTMDRAGNLYGTACYGGTQANDCHITGGCGTIFELVRGGSGFIFRPLYQFHDGAAAAGDVGIVGLRAAGTGGPIQIAGAIHRQACLRAAAIRPPVKPCGYGEVCACTAAATENTKPAVRESIAVA